MTRSQISNWVRVIVVLLLAWGLRLCSLEAVPPGWRDDELINIHALSGELLAGHFPLYFTGASGHEPLYHYLHAGLHSVLGFNVLSGHILSVACGLLTVALTYTLTRRLFGRTTAFIASLALATSFWSLIYSRTAIRHSILPPCALATFYVFWRSGPKNPRITGSVRSGFVNPVWAGLLLGASLYTYYAARLLPVLLVLFAAYLALFHRDQFSRRWRGFLLASMIAAALVVPMWIAIAQGSSDAAVQGIGADARLAELAVPLRELRAGNPRPLLETTWKTLGMFHATGDPEWLYNVSGRPVFDLLGGALLWAGIALCLYRWRQPRYFFLLLWLGLGLLPAFVSTPPASLSHTILAQPVAYILPALALSKVTNRAAHVAEATAIRWSFAILAILFVATNAVRDLRDYFIIWPQQDMVRLLYRADYREAAAYLDTHPGMTDVAVSSGLMGPWDRLALDVDTRHGDITARLFNPERALVWVNGKAPTTVLLTSWPRMASPIDGFLETQADPPEIISPHLAVYALPPLPDPQLPIPFRFANGLELTNADWIDEERLAPDQEAVMLTTWLVAAPLDLPPLPIVANPPPPGVYSGPRLAVFTHLLAADGVFLGGDDGLWVDPLTLRPGDSFIQAHHLALPSDAPDGPYTLEIGLYDPLTGERWAVLSTSGEPVADRVLLPAAE
ncbi:MAG: glycosyltransferase family 39 protein [Chloroflexota bacterium]|nr:glycosyltransferase family 39 protein [Chloroflexota bacterium]